MKQLTPQSTKANPKGAVFLTPDGVFAGDTAGEHRKSLKNALQKSGMTITDVDDDDDSPNIVKLALGLTGMARVSAGSTLTLDVVHPLTSSQKNSIKNLIISKGYKKDDTVLDLNGKMKDKNSDLILNSLFEKKASEKFD